MITSALPGEGKSFSAINLAISIAMELDNTVMLVDADVARPSISTCSACRRAKVCWTYCRTIPRHLAVMFKTNIEKLSIPPSGTPPQSHQLLPASDAMIRLLDDMSTRYSDRIIIFDLATALADHEARVLATHMGQVVMVVNAENTAQAAVKQAITTIESCPVKMMILNQVRTPKSAGYGYGYEYGYGTP